MLEELENTKLLLLTGGLTLVALMVREYLQRKGEAARVPVEAPAAS